MRKIAATVVTLAVGCFAAPALAADAPSPLEQQLNLAGRPAVKIRVRENGWYRVSRARLFAAGLPRAAQARLLQLYADGKQVPITVRGVRRGRLASNGAIEFYGLRRRTVSTDARTYWLVVGSEPGKRIPATAVGRPRSGTYAKAFEYTAVRVGLKDYITFLKNGDQPNFFGQRISTAGASETVAVTGLDRRSRFATLDVAVHGLSTLPHLVEVALNGNDLGVLSFAGQAPAQAKFIVPTGLLKEGENVVRMRSARGETDISVFASLRLTYPRLYRAERDVLSFVVEKGRQVRVSGFTRRPIRLVDITNASDAQVRIPTVRRTRDGYSFTVPAARTWRRFLALGTHRARTPAAVVGERPSTLFRSSTGADLVILSHRKFIGSLGPLKRLREREGLRVRVVDVEDVYDEFAYGAHGPDAVKTFLARVRAHWQPAPRFVLLVGDATSDPRNLLGTGETDYLPTKLLETNYSEAASDGWLADFDEDGVPELALGRLPVQTKAQAARVVAKIVGYKPLQRAAPSGRALLVSDKNETWFNFDAANARLGTLLSGLMPVEVKSRNGSASDAVLRRQILEALNEGPRLVNYFGHGGYDIWATSGLLESKDVAGFTNRSSLSLYVMMTCNNGNFVVPKMNSLGEALLRDGPGGAMGVYASSSYVGASQQPALVDRALRGLLGDRPATLGDAMVQAKAVVTDMDIRETFVLLGDPTAKLVD